MSAKRIVSVLASESGVEINGRHPWDIRVHDERFYRRVLADGSLGFGESFLEGWWDCDDLEELFSRITSADVERKIGRSVRTMYEAGKARLLNLQSRRRSAIVAARHYDVSIDHYCRMTDPWITLSCGYWKEAINLAQAQEAKLDLICRKIGVRGSDRVLDIGCGFGSFVRFAANRYGCSAVGVNISAEQVKHARELADGLPVAIYEGDYRDSSAYTEGGLFDAIVSAGMFEHVGHKNYRAYMEVAHRCLKDRGLFLLHTVGANVSNTTNDPWFDKYIFPNGLVPSIQQIGKAIEGLFVMEDWHNFGVDYVKTLRAWFDNLDSGWQGSRATPSYRLWKYYLLCSAGVFRSRQKQLWQIVLSKGGVPGGYTAVR
jgi:cyclopropane-fatty-acyl-phospholipid synthase